MTWFYGYGLPFQHTRKSPALFDEEESRAARGKSRRQGASECVLQRKLHDPGIDRGASDLPEVSRRRNGQAPGVTELRVIEQIEEFRPELQGVFFPDASSFDQRSIKVELAGAKEDTDSGVAIARPVPDLRECRC